MTSKFTESQFDKARFLEITQEFLEAVDKARKKGSVRGLSTNDFRDKMNPILEPLRYESTFNFGQSLFSGVWEGDKACSMAFYRKDTIRDGFVNQKERGKLGVSRGIYIWLGYADQEEQKQIELLIGSGGATDGHRLADEIDKERDSKGWIKNYERKDFAKIKEQIAEDFLYLVNEFNQIPLEDFKIEEQEMANLNENSRNSQSGESKNPPLNQILYGPPGTGKTYNAINRALEILHAYGEIAKIPSERGEAKAEFDKFRESGQIEFVTFHQSFSYEEFVEGIKPIFVDENGNEVEHSKNMIYKTKGGIFKEICKNALGSQKPYILIIDEINRGNISKILGELITLIEPSKRINASAAERARGVGDEGLRVSLPYSGRKFDDNRGFGVPSNLYIIGTMNTADRSIALLDTALRRRFEFVEMMPDCEHKDISTECEGVDLRQLLEKMNERIEFLLGREHQIGHSFFMGVNSLDELRGIFAKKIIPLLQEYFYDDYGKIDAVLNGNGMVRAFSMGDLGVKISEDLLDNDKKIYRITPPSAWNLENFTKIYEN